MFRRAHLSGPALELLHRRVLVISLVAWLPLALNLTLAGRWYAFVSIPIFQFILFRWYVRLVILFVFLWRVSRLDLRLLPTHPDRAGGLGFLDVILLVVAATPVLPLLLTIMPLHQLVSRLIKTVF